MNAVSKNKVLLIIIAVLLLTNIGLLVFFLRNHHGHEEEKRVGFTERLRKEVGFTKQQMDIFEPKKKAFWQRMHEKFDTIKRTKEDFYYLMYDPSVPDSVMMSKAERIGQQQRDLDLNVIRHFKDVRTLCTPEQLPKFDSVLPAIIKRMTDRPDRR